jgi:hypothetical protein
MTRHFGRINLGTAVLLVGLACASQPSEEPAGDSSPAPPLPPAAPALAPAPWSASVLPPDSAPAVYLTQWQKADNRATCAVLAPASLGDGAGATPRAATFSGGWAVAYDRPGTRSAFGIAGTGSSATDDAYDAWPHTIRWADSSSAGYGPEGGSGPNQLAYLRVTGQECLYNVWSRLGVPHLEHLLSQLRFVE